jgi:hypothetical protein
MNVFISWSGDRSKTLALHLHDWLKAAVQRADPWMSERDLEPGQRWNEEISARLKDTNFGLICLTPENVLAPWLLFEAGALAKAVEAAHVVPVLLGVHQADLTFPLAQFQAVEADQAGLRSLASAVNRALGEHQLSPTVMNNIFTGLWPALEKALGAIPPAASGTLEGARRSDRQLLEDIVEGVRTVQRAFVPGKGVANLATADSYNWEDYYIKGVNLANTRGDSDVNLKALHAYASAIALMPKELPQNARSRVYAYRGAIFEAAWPAGRGRTGSRSGPALGN